MCKFSFCYWNLEKYFVTLNFYVEKLCAVIFNVVSHLKHINLFEMQYKIVLRNYYSRNWYAYHLSFIYTHTISTVSREKSICRVIFMLHCLKIFKFMYISYGHCKSLAIEYSLQNNHGLFTETHKRLRLQYYYNY